MKGVSLNSLENKPWKSRDAFMAILILVVVIIVFRLVEEQLNITKVLPGAIEVSIFVLMTYAVIVGIILYFTVFKYKTTIADLGIKRFKAGRALFLSIVWFVGLQIVIQAYGRLATWACYLLKVCPPEQVNTKIPDLFGRGYFGFTMAILIGVIIGPFIEELFFRGFLYTAFKHTLGVPGAIILSSLIFGFFHTSPWLIFPTALIGAALAYLYEKGGSLGYPFVLHSLNNVVSIIIVYVMYGR